MSTADSRPRASGGRVRLYGGLSVLLLIAVAVRWTMTHEPGVTFKEAPEETRGVWTTSEPRYAGRAIEVTASRVTLRRGEAGAISGQLDIARELIDGDERILRLEYESPDGADAIEIVPGADGTMYLRNQPEVVWTVGPGSGYQPLTQPTLVVEQPSNTQIPLGPGALWVILAVVVVGGGALLLGSRGSGESAASDGPGLAPSLVRGVWETPDSRFEGRSIRIAPGYGFSQFGPGDIRVGGVITSVTQTRENGSRVVEIEYRTRDDGPETLQMVIDRTGHMRLAEGPQSIWVRRT